MMMMCAHIPLGSIRIWLLRQHAVYQILSQAGLRTWHCTEQWLQMASACFLNLSRQ